MIGNTVIRKLNQDVAKRNFVSALLRASSSAAAQMTLPLAEENGNLHPPPFFRTNERFPSNHSLKQSGQYYTIDPNIKKQLFLHGGLPKQYELQIKTFKEACLMVRQPALEIMSYLKSSNFSNPAIRYVLYGKLGCGKTLTLAHLLHYGVEAGFILIHIPWVPNWFRRCRESADSTTREGFVDLPLDAAAWLIHFKNQNSILLNHLKLTVGQEYVWSKRETTPKGAPLMDLVDLGINRVKYASDCVSAITNEIKQHTDLGRCKTLVIIDGFNAFFYPKTIVKTDDKVLVPPSKITLTDAFLNVSKFDWKNAAVIVSVDRLAVGVDKQASELPRYLLGKEGFEHLDPFIPVQVEDYSNKELESCLGYYADRMWLTNEKGRTEEGHKELGFLSAMNPYQLMKICASL